MVPSTAPLWLHSDLNVQETDFISSPQGDEAPGGEPIPTSQTHKRQSEQTQILICYTTGVGVGVSLYLVPDLLLPAPQGLPPGAKGANCSAPPRHPSLGSIYSWEMGLGRGQHQRAHGLQAKASGGFIYRQVPATRPHTGSGQKTPGRYIGPSTHRHQSRSQPGPCQRDKSQAGWRHGRERAPVLAPYQRSPIVAPTPEGGAALGQKCGQ